MAGSSVQMLPESEYKAPRALQVMRKISAAASAAGFSDMTPDEINAEIHAPGTGQNSTGDTDR